MRFSILKKVGASGVDAFIVVFFSMPLLWIVLLNTWKMWVVGMFLVYNLVFAISNKNVSLGMMLLGRKWDRDVGLGREILFVVFYTMSFATLFISVWFPFDIFLINIFLLQLPTVLMTGTTLHAYLSGKGMSVKA